eukprot:gb/GECH01014006.1/.p1 GENE.gb/GECH01014006.1/~~gb/GECH01014006.1/.p1  ORF type:complete len:239 (+),score=78.61 gb/GECH01014006.1/:1-717(+)
MYKKLKLSPEEYDYKLNNSSTLYVGNLSFYTNEEQLLEVFSKCGPVDRVVMGLDRFKKTPCGFCFVEYQTKETAEEALKLLPGTVVDNRSITLDMDAGFQEGRQYGRGATGGQVRDDFRVDYDPGRGGYGAMSLYGVDKMRQYYNDIEPPYYMHTQGQGPAPDQYRYRQPYSHQHQYRRRHPRYPRQHYRSSKRGEEGESGDEHRRYAKRRKRDRDYESDSSTEERRAKRTRREHSNE